MKPALESRSVTKRFGDFTAIDSVSLAFEPGKVHAVVGQNGAGKTTFSRLICGLYEPSAGEILLDGSPLRAGDIRSTREQGVDMVHQNFSLPPSFTVAEALELFDDNSKPLMSRAALERKWNAALDRHGSPINVRKRVRDLSVETRQSLEIIRALEGHPKVLILDEPTAVLAPPEVQSLFERVHRLRDSGLTILIILHKLSEVFAVADTVSVLREGAVTLATTPIRDVTAQEITQHIIGPDTNLPQIATEVRGIAHSHEQPTAPPAKTPVMALSHISAAAGQSDRALDDVSLTIHSGEILGIAGVEGNGQETLLDILSGHQRSESGSMHLLGEDVTKASTLDRRRKGVRFVPSDRNAQGISLTTSLWENISLTDLLIEGTKWFSPRARKAVAVEKLGIWKVRYRNPEQLAGELSGGNVQRVILSRELGDGTRLVIAGNPTRGLDLAATAFVRASLSALADDGVAVIVVSADLDEVRDISNRICVLRGGRIVADLPGGASITEIGSAMVGGDNA